MKKMISRTNIWRFVLLTILALAISGCSLIVGHSRQIPALGRIHYKEFRNGNAKVTLEKSDKVMVLIMYRGGQASDKIVIHPDGHPLKGKVVPLADGKTLHDATRLLPTIIELAKGEKSVSSEELISLFKDFPEDLYNLPFEETPGRWRLSEGDMLFITGCTFQPYARDPVLCYWGPAGADSLGDDRLYCGYWELDKTCLNLPLKFPSNSLHAVKTGDIIEFLGYNLVVENIEHDNNTIRGDNLLTLRIEGLPDLSKVQKGGAACGPIEPEDFIREVCFPDEPELSELGTHQGPLTVKEIEERITCLANCKTNLERATAVKNTLREIGYTEEEITCSINESGMEDIWVIKQGASKDIALIVTYYDKIGNGSQGVIDNGVGVIVTLGAAEAMRLAETDLTYIFLFWGGEEIGQTWGQWILSNPELKDPIRYATIIKGYGLRDCERTLDLDRRSLRGWLNWSFPVLKINSTGGDPNYQKHTVRDNLSFCDFDLVNEAEDSLVDWMVLIENSLHKDPFDDRTEK